MGMNMGGSGDLNAEINVTPLVDVMLVLLVIFMITAPMMNTGVDVDLPPSPAKRLIDEKDAKLKLTIGKGYKLQLSGTPVTWAELGKKIKANEKIQKEKALWVEADQGLPYGVVVRAMAIVQNNGVNNLKMLTRPSQDLTAADLDKKAASTPSKK